jgi:hypothetical protein
MTDLETNAAVIHSKSSLPLERFSRAALLLALLVVAAVAVSYLLLALPANDDFIRATQPSQVHPNFWKVSSLKLFVRPMDVDQAAVARTGSGFWNYCGYLYFRWQGRWVSYGIESAVLPHGDMTKLYPALLGAVAIINLLGLFVICRFFTRGASRWFSLACTAGLAAVLWAQMPSLAQTMYWFVGGIENVMVLSLAGMLLVGLVALRASVPWIIVACGLAIVTTGCHELFGTMLCIALGAGTVAAFWMGSQNRLAWRWALIAAIIGLAIVVGAPGNKVRMAKDVSHHVRHLNVVLKIAGKQFWISGREWLFDPKLLAVSLIVAFSPTLEAARPVWTTAGRVPWRSLIPVTWLAMLCAGFFMPSWAFVAVMPPRTLSGNYLVFAVGWLVIVFVWTRRMDVRDADVSIAGLRSRGATSVAMLLLAASLVLGGNTLEGLHDLASRKVFHWRTSVEQRYVLLARSKGKDLVLPRLSPASRLLYSSEVWFDPTNWANFSLADYFHVKSVRVPPVEKKGPAAAPGVDEEKPPQNM